MDHQRYKIVAQWDVELLPTYNSPWKQSPIFTRRKMKSMKPGPGVGSGFASQKFEMPCHCLMGDLSDFQEIFTKMARKVDVGAELPMQFEQRERYSTLCRFDSRE
jgi:hypothetical protein